MHTFPDARSVVRALQPDEPIILNRPHAAARAARFFVEKFPGKSLYAVKANPSPDLLQVLWDNGVTHYDVASIAEVRLVRATLPGATLCFMHPVKAPSAIREAYRQHGVRTFSLDSVEELEKIVEACRDDAGEAAQDLRLCVRLRVSSEYSELSLASKFGCDLTEAPALLQQARQHADWLGVCFHVGSQAMTPFAYVQALERVRIAIGEASVVIDMIDVGGGFPSVYPGMEPPPLEDYFQIIHQNFYNLPIAYNAELWCEPGRALCAEYSSLIVKVEKRRGEELYINDGAYGALFDAAHVDWKFPVRALEDDLIKPDMDFAFYGPTCDDADYMQGPFVLPEDIQAGDYIEIGMLGAYGAAMKTDFNGFGAADRVLVTDEPMASLYDGSRQRPAADNVVSLR
ncbi:MAG: type III PLP-dependent enzyme [Qipengyuania citrea]|uniref:ornithine decarboxylase n=1 Tax=Qipengyuania citrea LAMA 915 TaxID=1306953 RepID=A0A0L1KEZ1_9SPHN|nr:MULTISPECIES: type III PLP-dependent enzyme [Erythrobacteraceae]MCZ4265193.1 type III PLP-dependent enzyme [Erythrobacter sp. G21629-S1]HBQ53610.1 type III PLP-dependent enzyme [Erythrobacter sp.]KNH02424.1 Ornithine decarboxylase / Arginine decarboxylase [Qipengyuania citrea LAMA 915]KZX92065.1 decarboxylase [Erythrobacter sp. HI0019]KZY04151.1 decarboxylase [Erythrobacter sp. HI0028]